MKFSRKTSLFLFFVVLPCFCAAQSTVYSTLKTIFSNIREKKIEAIDTKILFKKENIKPSLALLANYSADTNASVRDKAYNLSALIALRSNESEVRKSVVSKLIAGCNDSDQIVSRNCSRSLESFLLTDFDPNAKSEILYLVQMNNKNIGQNAQLAAFVGVENLEPVLLSRMEDKILPKEKWAIRLALARIGHLPSVEYILERVKSIAVNDNMIYEAVPALVYTRRKESFAYLISIIQSDRKDCTSANNDSPEPLLCAYRVLEYITPVLKNFPLKTSASGDLDGDYKKALETSRKWFLEKGDNYGLNINTY